MVRVARFLLKNGVDRALVGACLRHQSLPVVELVDADMRATVAARSRGGLTGSRVAAACGRIPAEDSVRFVAERCGNSGFTTDYGKLTAALFVDNVYTMSETFVGAISLAREIGHRLKSFWDSDFKPGNRKSMVARGLDPGVSQQLLDEYPLLPTFEVLGHILADNASIAPCFQRTSAALWRAFYRNPGSRVAQTAGKKTRIKLMDISVKPVLECRMGRWPFQLDYAQKLDRLQRKMLSRIIKVERWPDESDERYFRRRGRTISGHLNLDPRVVTWSHLWAIRVQTWNSHLRRPRNLNSWAAKLLRTQDSLWLQARRALQNAVSVFAGRTDTRVE